MVEKPKKAPRTYALNLGPQHHQIFCDGAPLLTPARKPYLLPTEALAKAVMAEWQAQAEDLKINTSRMPLTRLAATAIDIVAEKKEKTVADCLAFSATELLCHREGGATDLSKRQQEIWQPYLDWAALSFGALFCVGEGIMPIEQPADVVTGIEKRIKELDAFSLTGLMSAVEASGSLVLGLALALGEKQADEIFNAAELERLAQIEAWGEDPLTASQLDATKEELLTSERWFALLRA